MADRLATAACIALVKERGYALFPDLDRLCRDEFDMDTDGIQRLDRGGLDNTVLWAGASDGFLDVIEEMLAVERRIRERRINVSAYLDWWCQLTMNYGGDLMPIIEGEIAAEGYESPHWLPVAYVWDEFHHRRKRRLPRTLTAAA